MNLLPRSSRGASVSRTANGFRLAIPASTQKEYRLAQIDSYARLPRRRFSLHPPASLSLRARASSQDIPGTWGFGLWNNPFGLSLGFGGNPFTIPALPNTIWFFHASPKNHLSFRDDKPAQGFLAQVFSSPRFHPLLLSTALTIPFSRRRGRRLLGRIIVEDSTAMEIDTTQWHTYRLEWSLNRSAFWVDEFPVLNVPASPRGPLELILWVDNQYAAFTPDGKMAWGLENNPTDAWLEIEDIELKASGQT